MTTEVFDAAVSVARRVGYRNVTRKLIAEELAAPTGPYAGRADQAYNYLVNVGRMAEWVAQLIEAKDRLALVPGPRPRVATGASFWSRFDREDFLAHAYRCADDVGLLQFTLSGVAREVGCSRGTLLNYFGTLEGLRGEVVKKAIAAANLKLCAQAIAGGLECAASVPDKMRRDALKALA